MITFADSCIAKDRSGEAKIFRAGGKVRVRRESCPQVDGAVATVRSCFFQDQTLSEHGMAVLLNELSWVLCKDCEVL